MTYVCSYRCRNFHTDFRLCFFLEYFLFFSFSFPCLLYFILFCFNSQEKFSFRPRTFFAAVEITEVSFKGMLFYLLYKKSPFPLIFFVILIFKFLFLVTFLIVYNKNKMKIIIAYSFIVGFNSERWRIRCFQCHAA